MDKKREGWFVKGLLVGVVAASVVSLLLAPKSGAALRSDLVGRGKELKARAGTSAAELSRQGTLRLREVRRRGVSALCRLHQPGAEATVVAGEATRIEGSGSASTHAIQAGGGEAEKS